MLYASSGDLRSNMVKCEIGKFKLVSTFQQLSASHFETSQELCGDVPFSVITSVSCSYTSKCTATDVIYHFRLLNFQLVLRHLIYILRTGFAKCSILFIILRNIWCQMLLSADNAHEKVQDSLRSQRHTQPL